MLSGSYSRMKDENFALVSKETLMMPQLKAILNTFLYFRKKTECGIQNDLNFNSYREYFSTALKVSSSLLFENQMDALLFF